MQITRVICPEDKYAIKCPYEMEAEGIAIHNSANDASAMAEISYMIGNNNKVSFHVAIDEYRIVEGIPFDRNTWNAGDGANGRGNRKMISIEICYSKSGGDKFSEAERNAAEYTAFLLKQRNWGIEKVYKHQDFSGKYCPHRTLDLGWERFLDLVKMFLNDEMPKGEEVNNDGSDVEMKTYCNGSTSEMVYSSTDCLPQHKIGLLNPREKCDCFGIFNGRAMVRYQVGKTDTYKIGFCKWLGGVK